MRTLSIGGAMPETLATGQTSAGWLALSGDSVYWSTSDAIRSVPLEGGAVTTLVSGLSVIRGIRVDDNDLYYATSSSIFVTPPGVTLVATVM